MAAVMAISATAQPVSEWRPLSTHLEWDAASVQRVETVIVRATRSDQSYVTSRIELRCAPAELRTLESVTYRPDGSEISRDTTPVAWESIPPNSAVEMLRAAVC
jgi:hypothetical protein